MAATTTPIFTNIPKINWAAAAITAANTAMDGTGTVTTVFTADATDGSYVKRIVFKSLGTCVATVARIFVNNGSTNATAANNALIMEVPLTATTASNSASNPGAEIFLDLQLPAGYKLNVTLGTAVSAGHMVTVFGGDY